MSQFILLQIWENLVRENSCPSKIQNKPCRIKFKNKEWVLKKMNHHVETKSINLNLHCESLATIFFVRFKKKNSCGSLCRCWTKIVFLWSRKEKGCPAMLCLFKIKSLEAVWVQCWLRMVFDNIWKQSWNWIIFSESKAYPGITFLDSWRKNFHRIRCWLYS